MKVCSLLRFPFPVFLLRLLLFLLFLLYSYFSSLLCDIPPLPLVIAFPSLPFVLSSVSFSLFVLSSTSSLSYLLPSSSSCPQFLFVHQPVPSVFSFIICLIFFLICLCSLTSSWHSLRPSCCILSSVLSVSSSRSSPPRHSSPPLTFLFPSSSSVFSPPSPHSGTRDSYAEIQLTGQAPLSVSHK